MKSMKYFHVLTIDAVSSYKNPHFKRRRGLDERLCCLLAISAYLIDDLAIAIKNAEDPSSQLIFS